MPVHYASRGSTAREIAANVEQAVTAGALAPGAAVQPIRHLAAELGVNPNTVAAAYRMLRDRGVVQTAGRRGTRVRARPATAPLDRTPLEVPPGVRDLADGRPAARLLPELAEPLALGAAAAAGRGYGDDDIAAALAAAARWRLDADAVPAQHLALAHSTLDAVERVLQAHLRPGDRVAIEDPAWANLVDLLAALGLVAEPVPLDDDGMRPEQLKAALTRGARAVIVTSRAQVPTGAAISPDRAHALRHVLSQHPDVLLIEDDHAAEIAGAALASLAGATGFWAHVRSASKAWGPDLRLAVLAGDPATIDRLRARQQLGPGWVSHAIQEAVVVLWRSQPAQTLVRNAERQYAERRAALLAALSQRGVLAHGRSGVNVWVPVRDETTAATSLLGSGWAVAPGSRFRLASSPGLRITIATLRASEISPLADATARAVASVSSRGV